MFRSPSPSPAGDENLKGQIDFLNSVIVDMQKKNDKLKSKIDLLENAGILGKNTFRREGRGRSGHSLLFVTSVYAPRGL